MTMLRRAIVPAVLLAAMAQPLSAALPARVAQSPDAPVWADEFDTPGAPDPRNWTYERGFVRNEERQWYQPGNARVEGGRLVIEARRETVANPDYSDGATDWRRSRPHADYTSSSLTTRGLHSFQYGRFEMRARIDTRAGLWPAFWTLGVSGGWPRNGEIDVMEYYAGTLLANVAWGGDRPGRAVWDDVRRPIAPFGPEWSSQFHVWRMDWTSRNIRLFVDDALMNETDLSGTVNRDGSGVNPLQQPHYLIVNLAVGGTQGGDPSATVFPARYEVDYIRVYAPR